MSKTKGDLSQQLKFIEKLYGDGAVYEYGRGLKLDVKAISTGSIGLDLATGIGGIPRGRITEIYGKESSGKTTICLQTIAEAQKLGGKALYIDVEHALDMEYAERLGVNTDKLFVSQPDYEEHPGHS